MGEYSRKHPNMSRFTHCQYCGQKKITCLENHRGCEDCNTQATPEEIEYCKNIRDRLK